MTRCKHQSVTLIEFLDATSNWHFVNGELEDDGTCDARLNGKIEVACDDCGYEKRCGPRSKRPAWIERLTRKLVDR